MNENITKHIFYKKRQRNKKRVVIIFTIIFVLFLALALTILLILKTTNKNLGLKNAFLIKNLGEIKIKKINNPNCKVVKLQKKEKLPFFEKIKIIFFRALNNKKLNNEQICDQLNFSQKDILALDTNGADFIENLKKFIGKQYLKIFQIENLEQNFQEKDFQKLKSVFAGKTDLAFWDNNFTIKINTPNHNETEKNLKNFASYIFSFQYPNKKEVLLKDGSKIYELLRNEKNLTFKEKNNIWQLQNEEEPINFYYKKEDNQLIFSNSSGTLAIKKYPAQRIFSGDPKIFLGKKYSKNFLESLGLKKTNKNLLIVEKKSTREIILIYDYNESPIFSLQSSKTKK